LSDYEKFTNEEIIKVLEFDIKQYRRKHDYHSSLAQDYLGRADEVEKKILKIREEMKNENKFKN